jgi:hypothetical protein
MRVVRCGLVTYSGIPDMSFRYGLQHAVCYVGMVPPACSVFASPGEGRPAPSTKTLAMVLCVMLVPYHWVEGHCG